jgi:hypothetical protein
MAQRDEDEASFAPVDRSLNDYSYMFSRVIEASYQVASRGVNLFFVSFY